MKSTAMEILLCLLAGFPVLKANDPTDEKNPFDYNWRLLQIGGLIFAGVLCFLGIVILLSGKCKCKPKRRSSMQINVASKRSLAGGASEC